MADWRAYWKGKPRKLAYFKRQQLAIPVFDRTATGERLNGGDSSVVLFLGLDGLPVEDDDDEA